MIRIGMKVRAADGRKLGTVVELGERCFLAERGFFFPREYELLYREVAEVRGNEVWLGLPKLEEGPAPGRPPSEPGLAGADTTGPLRWAPSPVTWTVDPTALTGREPVASGEPRRSAAEAHEEPAPAP